MTSIRVTVNGRPVEAEVSPRQHLADFLREQLFLTGTHIGCEHGICGACTVEIDGEISRSCITYAVTCDGASIRTIEGFDEDPLMGKLRDAFTRNHALQCGYCTPGMLVAARDLVRRKADLSREDIRTEMSGNLCRCTGYVGIVNAIEQVMQETAQEARAPSARAWLGPAPGPSRQVAEVAPAAPVQARKPVATAPAQTKRTSRSPITVTVGAIEEVDGATRLMQTFTLPHPREAVWALMSDPVAVATCIPGLSLEPQRPDGTFPGRMEIALGPVKASFSGLGTVEAHPAEYRQVIEGRGGDKRSGSQASGKADYRLLADGADATRVEVALSYVLAGPLAQIGRAAIVRDLVRRVGEAFAQTVDARLAGEEAAPSQSFGAFTLLLQLVLDRIRALFAGSNAKRG
ncbi:MAG: 2Fe-2S iron-sulfur cluster binding domain-containing protein [Hyphomicrobiales bacterium]|nr:MAG: 2Fe-2S iron-sulfur cluster binding domain-containing protein [Hyphomicrobiales bacterium]